MHRQHAARIPHGMFSTPVGAAMMIAALLFTAVAVAGPRDARAATPMVAACSGVNLRTAPSTSAPAKTNLVAGTQVGVTATVTGDAWTVACPTSLSGNTWYVISEVNGTSVTTLFGVSALYGATGLFVASTATPSPTASPAVSPVPSDPVPTPTPTPVPGGPFLEGVDVSNWQGVIDWSAVAASGRRFAYVKATEGTAFVDASFAVNRAGARAAGLYVGAYHYARPGPGVGAAAVQADHFIDIAQPAAGDLLPVLDLEETGGLSTAALQEWVREYLDRIYERLGVRGVIYVSPNFWKARMGDTVSFATAGYRVLWVADWRGYDTPAVPGGNWGGQGWTFWQYTSEGAVPGITGRADLDRYAGTDLTPVLIGGVPLQPAPPAASLTFTSSAPRTSYREYVTLTATLQPLGANRPVLIQRLSPADAAWTTIAALTTDASGTASFPYGPPYSTQFRAVFTGADDLGAATSPEATVSVSATAQIKPYASAVKTVARGTRITYTAVVRPKVPDGAQTVSFLIYRRVGGAWVYSTSATKPLVGGSATFAWTWRTSGEWYIRVRANASVWYRSSLSPIVRLKVR